MRSLVIFLWVAAIMVFCQADPIFMNEAKKPVIYYGEGLKLITVCKNSKQLF